MRRKVRLFEESRDGFETERQRRTFLDSFCVMEVASLACFSAVIIEYQQASMKGTLSPAQCRLLELRARGASYEVLKHELNVQKNESLGRGFVRTVLGYYWTRYCEGGRLAYLPEHDVADFKKLILERSNGLNCATRSEALKIAYDLRRARIQKGIRLLHLLRLPGLVDRLARMMPPVFPDSGWLGKTCHALGLKICSPQTLEIVRRYFCNSKAVADFFVKFGSMFDRDPRLIWNADETQLNALKRFRVLCEKGKLPLLQAMDKLPHLTGLVTISAAGDYMKPLVILKNLVHLKDLSELEHHCFFGTSANGWITKDLWLYYALIFSAQISEYRLTLPANLQNDDVLLIIDGHKSRLSLTAAIVFYIFGIDVLVLPPHSSHLMQPFDVSIASPLKIAFKYELDQRIHKYIHADPQKREKSQILRKIMVEAFLDALTKAATPGNGRSGFERSGICPYNPLLPLEFQYAMEPPDPEIFRTAPTVSEINNMILTFPDGLSFLSRQEIGRNLQDSDLELDINSVLRRLKQNTVSSGRPLSRLPPFFLSGSQGDVQKTNYE